jgi:hypothetical protein
MSAASACFDKMKSPNWNAIYVAVALSTIATILGLSWFSGFFS